MRWLVLLLSLAMPVVSWFSQQGVFGPTNGAISDRYPTLIVAAGYAFAIWGLIFLWDMVFGAWQAFSRRAAISRQPFTARRRTHLRGSAPGRRRGSR